MAAVRLALEAVMRTAFGDGEKVGSGVVTVRHAGQVAGMRCGEQQRMGYLCHAMRMMEVVRPASTRTRKEKKRWVKGIEVNSFLSSSVFCFCFIIVYSAIADQDTSICK